LSAVLLAVPNFSEGRERETIEAIMADFAKGAELLDRHSDAVHDRTVLTLALHGEGSPTAPLLAGARACVERIDLRAHEGAHPCVGALDVCPVVFTEEADRPAAAEAARVAASAIAELEVPVFLYGELASEPERSERAYFRAGGLAELARRMAAGELLADYGPAVPHPSAGATLITARPPLAAFNLLLDTGDVNVAREVAEGLREAGGGLAGVRAIGVDLDGRAQVSTNVHDPVGTPLAEVIERVRMLAAAHHAAPVEGEVVGLVPQAALAGLPDDPPLAGFDPDLQVIERRLDPGE
jgi:glutamate formiminotransferase